MLPHLSGSGSRKNVSSLLSRDEEKTFIELLEETRKKQKIRDEKTGALYPAKRAKAHFPQVKKGVPGETEFIQAVDPKEFFVFTDERYGEPLLRAAKKEISSLNI